MAKKVKTVRLSVTLELPAGRPVRGLEAFVRDAILTMAGSDVDGEGDPLPPALRVILVKRLPAAEKQGR
jgi:hypothetical protein